MQTSTDVFPSRGAELAGGSRRSSHCGTSGPACRPTSGWSGSTARSYTSHSDLSGLHCWTDHNSPVLQIRGTCARGLDYAGA